MSGIRRQEHDAVIDQWFVVRVKFEQAEAFHIVGTVWGDRQARFRNGRMIQTSVILTALAEIGRNCTVRTINSTYLLGDPIDLNAKTVH